MHQAPPRFSSVSSRRRQNPQGGIAGDTGKGAAARAVAGTMRGGMKQHEANASAKQQPAQSASAQVQRQYQQAQSAYTYQRNTFKRGFYSCMEARNYSAK